jgi:hypothetical protein
MFEFDDMAFDDVTVAADDFDELPGHGCCSFFAPNPTVSDSPIPPCPL